MERGVARRLGLTKGTDAMRLQNETPGLFEGVRSLELRQAPEPGKSSLKLSEPLFKYNLVMS